MSTAPEFSSDLTVKLRRTWGSDRDVPETARVSSKGFDEDIFDNPFGFDIELQMATSR